MKLTKNLIWINITHIYRPTSRQSVTCSWIHRESISNRKA